MFKAVGGDLYAYLLLYGRRYCETVKKIFFFSSLAKVIMHGLDEPCVLQFSIILSQLIVHKSLFHLEL